LPHYFSWVIEDWLAGMGQPGSGLELVPQMLPYERRFLNWLLQSGSLQGSRESLADMVGIRGQDPLQVERRMLDLYRKFKDLWRVLDAYREGFGSGGGAVDSFVLSSERTEQDLQFLVEQNVSAIATLTEKPLNPEVVAMFDFQILHVPVKDREPPTLPQVQGYVDFARAEMAGGRRLVTHCLGGIGRTGTMLACYLVAEGMPAATAVREIRRIRPESIETEAQEATVGLYEEQIR